VIGIGDLEFPRFTPNDDAATLVDADD